MLREIARKHELELASLKTSVDGIIQRMTFNGDQLSDLPVPLDLGWKARTQKKTGLDGISDSAIKRLRPWHEISGLWAYE